MQQRIEAAAGDAAMELAAERLLAEARGLDQPGEIDAGADAERLEQVDQVLGADVAGIAAAVLHLRRVPADAAERAIEIAHARLVGRERIDQAGAAGVVEMRDQRRRRAPRAACGATSAFMPAGVAMPGGVAERDVVDAQLARSGPRRRPRRRDRPRPRTGSRTRPRWCRSGGSGPAPPPPCCACCPIGRRATGAGSSANALRSPRPAG